MTQAPTPVGRRSLRPDGVGRPSKRDVEGEVRAVGGAAQGDYSLRCGKREWGLSPARYAQPRLGPMTGNAATGSFSVPVFG